MIFTINMAVSYQLPAREPYDCLNVRGGDRVQI